MKKVLSLIMALSLLCSGFVYADEECVPCSEISLDEFNISTSTDIGQLRSSLKKAFSDDDFIKALSDSSYKSDMNSAKVYLEDNLEVLSIDIKSRETGEWIGNIFHMTEASSDNFACLAMYWDGTMMVTEYYVDDEVIDYKVVIGEPIYSTSSTDPNCVWLCNAIVTAGGCTYFCGQFGWTLGGVAICRSLCSLGTSIFCANSCSSTAPPYIPNCGLIGLPDCNK